MSFDIRVGWYGTDENGRKFPVYHVALVDVRGREVESFEGDFNCILAWIECRQCSL